MRRPTSGLLPRTGTTLGSCRRPASSNGSVSARFADSVKFLRGTRKAARGCLQFEPGRRGAKITSTSVITPMVVLVVLLINFLLFL